MSLTRIIVGSEAAQLVIPKYRARLAPSVPSLPHADTGHGKLPGLLRPYHFELSSRPCVNLYETRILHLSEIRVHQK